MPLSISGWIKGNKPAETTEAPAQKAQPAQAEGDLFARLRAFVADESWLKQVNRLVAEANQASIRVQQVIAERGVVERNRIQLIRDGSNPDEKIRDLSTQIRAAESEAKGKKAKARELVDAKIAGLGPASGGIWRAVVSKKQEILAAVEKLHELFLGSASGVEQNIAGAERTVQEYNKLAGGVWDSANQLVSQTGGPALSVSRPQMRFTRHSGLTEEVRRFVVKMKGAML